MRFLHERRLKTIEKNSQGAVTGELRYVYDGLDLIALLNGSDTLVASFTHGPEIDDPLIVRYAGNDYYFHKNHQGSVTEILNSNGIVAKTYEYDAFGNIIQETGPSLPVGFTYTGREIHPRSGLYYYRARFYDPRIGRFITQDPIRHLGGANLYAYVANEPIRLIDPLGLEPLPNCTKIELKPYFPDVDLDKIDIHSDGLPSYVPEGNYGYAGKDYNIYFEPGYYDPYSPVGVARIAHELVHVQQRQNIPPILFEIMYLTTQGVAPRDTPERGRLEKPAYDMEAVISRELQQRLQRGKFACP